MIHKEGHHRNEWHGGAAILVHETVPVKEIHLHTPLQAVAARVNIGLLIAIVSLNSSKSHEINERLLSKLKNQLPPPVLITGTSIVTTLYGALTLLTAEELKLPISSKITTSTS